MSYLSRSALGLLLGCAVTASCSGNGGGADGGATLTVQTFTSSIEPLAVNSHLIMGATDAILVDGQLFKADAQSAVDMVKASGKTLKTVFLTHAHPDHYGGLDVIKQAFPAASFVTTPEVLADFNNVAAPTLAGLKMQYGAVIADNLVTPTAVTGDTLTLEGQTLNILKLTGGESTASAALAVPSIGALFAGDHLYGKVHLFIGNCDNDKWQSNLATVRMVSSIKTYYPGHGSSGGTEIIDADSQYIKDALPILGSGKNTADVIAALQAKYPTFGATGLLGLSVPRFTSACNPKLVLPGDTYYPESLSAAADGSIFVGSVATGQVQKFAAGSTQPTTFIPATAGKGISGVYVDDAGASLYVCSVDPTSTNPTQNALKKYSLTTGTLTTTITLAGGAANFCNDMVLDGTGNLYVADSFGKIHKVAKNATTSTVWKTDPLLQPSTSMGFGADGIVWDGGTNLYVNTFSDSRLVRIAINADGTAGAATEITVTPKLMNPDGMRKIDATNLLVVEGGAGRLSKITISGTTATVTPIQTDLNGPTSVVLSGGKYYVSEGQLGYFFGQIPGKPQLPFQVRIFPAQ